MKIAGETREASVEPAHIALFTYNRLEHTRRTVEALARNELASESCLHVFSDAPRKPSDAAKVDAVRDYISGISGFKSVEITSRSINMGLAGSIISGVTEICHAHGRVIVLEDDLITSPYFLRYMNEALEMYESEPDVISIHGYIYPLQTPIPETYFIKGADCWGWATWSRGWALFNPDGQALLNQLEDKKLTHEFDFSGAHGYTAMLRKQIAGANDSWAIRWYASAFLNNKLTLYPGHSLVCNIGTDGSGSHCGETSAFNAILATRPVKCIRIPVEENVSVRREIGAYFRRQSDVSVKQRSSGAAGCNPAMTTVKRVLKQCLPPFAWDIAKRLRPEPAVQSQSHSIAFAGSYPDWATAQKNATGYDADLILQKTRIAMLKVRDGEAVYERDSVLFDKVEHSFPLLAGLLRAAIEADGNLSVLDFGGALGSSYFACKTFLPRMKRVAWFVVEQPAHVACGREDFESEELRFYNTVEECFERHQPKVLLLASVLQYLPEPYAVLEGLLKRRFDQVIIDRTAFLERDRDRLTVQTVPGSIYSASYPAWFFSETRFRETVAGAGYRIVADFPNADSYSPCGDRAYYKGFILQPGDKF